MILPQGPYFSYMTAVSLDPWRRTMPLYRTNLGLH